MLSEAETRGRRLIPRVHDPVDGIPYFDEELDVPQSRPHRVMVGEVMPVLASIAEEAGLTFLSDESIWYLHPETDEQRVYYGDCVLARVADVSRITAEDLVLVLEIVSTNDRRKELKDIHFQRLLNERNEVPEFALVFPDADDARALRWFRLVDGRYEEHDVAPGGHVTSREIPELELRVLPREQWAPGKKIAVYFRGEHRPSLAGERARAEEARARLEEARARLEEARARPEEARARAERLAAQLRALGIEPDA